MSRPEFKLLQLTDRGGLKYPTHIVLDSIVTLWKTLVAVETKDNLMAMFVQGSSRRILVQLTLIFLEETEEFQGFIQGVVGGQVPPPEPSIVPSLKNLMDKVERCDLVPAPP